MSFCAAGGGNDHQALWLPRKVRQTFTLCYCINQNYFKTLENAFTFPQPRQCHCRAIFFTRLIYWSFLVYVAIAIFPMLRESTRSGILIGGRFSVLGVACPTSASRDNGLLLTDGRFGSFVNKCVKRLVIEGFELVEIFSQVDAMLVMCLGASFWGRWDKHRISFVVKSP